MRVLIVEPHKVPYERDIENELHYMQDVVRGLIELVGLDEETTMVCNEEGKLIGLEGNRRVGRDIIAGTFFICGFNDEGEFCSLTDEQVEKYKGRFQEDEHYTVKQIEDSIFVEVYSGNVSSEIDDELEL